MGGDDEDGQVGVGESDFPQDLKAAHVGEPDVEHDEVKGALRELIEPGLSGGGHGGLGPEPARDGGEGGGEGVLVFDDEEGHGFFVLGSWFFVVGLLG